MIMTRRKIDAEFIAEGRKALDKVDAMDPIPPTITAYRQRVVVTQW